MSLYPGYKFGYLDDVLKDSFTEPKNSSPPPNDPHVSGKALNLIQRFNPLRQTACVSTV